MVDFDATNPGDSDIVSQFPANERAQRGAVSSGFSLEHDGSGTGRHKFPRGNTSARNALTSASIVNGSIFINTSASSAIPIIQAYSSVDAAWHDTGRFTSADEAKLDGITSGAGVAATTATSSEAAAATVSAMRSFSPYLLGITAKTFSRTGVEFGATTRDLTTASGSQSVSTTNTVKGVIIFAGVNASQKVSFGGSNGTAHGSIGRRDSGTPGWYTGSNIIIHIGGVSSDFQTATVSITSSGFELNWTKNGSPTGTADIEYLAITSI